MILYLCVFKFDRDRATRLDHHGFSKLLFQLREKESHSVVLRH